MVGSEKTPRSPKGSLAKGGLNEAIRQNGQPHRTNGTDEVRRLADWLFLWTE